ncbi:MAG: helix-turn-helix transcriptional regulator [Flavobacteriales bacterium]
MIASFQRPIDPLLPVIDQYLTPPRKMIQLNLQRLCKLKGIAKPYAFLAANGFSHHHAHSLANGAVKGLRFDHLEKLCRIYHCMPQELLDYKPNGRGLNPANDVLAPLRKQPVATKDLRTLIAELPPEEILNISAELQARYQKPPAETTNGQ